LDAEGIRQRLELRIEWEAKKMSEAQMRGDTMEAQEHETRLDAYLDFVLEVEAFE
jgi:hypothetical protein